MKNIQKLGEIYGQVPEKDKEIIANFFITFSFFEFGLKEYGFRDKRKSYPSSDWNAYISRIEKSFNPDDSPELREAVKYFRENPPGKQIFKKDGSLTFDNKYFTQKKNVDLRLLIEMIKTVRNNFFHGGKVKDFMKFDYERNINLFKNSLIIFEACLKIDDCISEFL